MWTVLFVSHVFSKLDGKVKRLQIVPVIYTLKRNKPKQQWQKEFNREHWRIFVCPQWLTPMRSGLEIKVTNFHTCTRWRSNSLMLSKWLRIIMSMASTLNFSSGGQSHTNLQNRRHLLVYHRKYNKNTSLSIQWIKWPPWLDILMWYTPACSSTQVRYMFSCVWHPLRIISCASQPLHVFPR